MDNVFKIERASYYISKKVFSKEETPKRKVQNYEIELYEKADNVSVINNVEYKQKQGNVLVAKPNDVRNSVGSFECRYIHFSCKDKEIVKLLDSVSGVSEGHDNEEIRNIFKKIINAQKSKSNSKKIYIQGCMLQLVSLLAFEKNKAYKGKYKRYEKEIEKACAFMKKNYFSSLNLCDVASAVHLSPTFFHEVFKDIKKQTPHDYLLDYRIKKAKEKLGETDLPLSQVAILCGFESQSYFSYVFKRKTSLTPKAYRDKKFVII